MLWVIAAGVAIRVALWAVTPWYLANDNHFPPVQTLLTEGRLPRPDECWVCYHPPLYYVGSAGAYWITDRVGRAFSAEAQSRYEAGRKAIQFLSVIAGSLTLVVCWRILTRYRELSVWQVAIGVAFVAVLPRHVLMSAMATNDAVGYLWQSAAILAAIDAARSGWRARPAMLCGLWVGLALLTKGYGLFTLAAIGVWMGGCIAVAAVRAAGADRGVIRRIATAGLSVLAVSVAVGGYPFARNYALYGRLHVDNFAIHETKMDMLPPATLGEVRFLSFRFGELLARPWVHTRYVDSFWTVVFAGYWFDAIGVQNTLKLCYEWEYRKQRLNHQMPDGGIALGRALRDYELTDVPAAMVPLARYSYIVGLVAALLLAGGVLGAVVRARRDATAGLLLVHFAACLAIVAAQTARHSSFTTMKAEFTLGMVSSIGFFLALATAGGVRRMRSAAVLLSAAVVIAMGAGITWFVVLERAGAAKATWLILPRVPAVLSCAGGGDSDRDGWRVATLD